MRPRISISTVPLCGDKPFDSIVIRRHIVYDLAKTYTTPMISLFMFFLSWAVYAGVFFAASQVLPAFHSDYREATLSVGFLVGLFNLLLVRFMRWFRLSTNVLVLGVLAFVLDVVLIRGTGAGGYQGNYYVTGNSAPVIVALLLAITLIVVEAGKRKLILDK